MRFFDGFFNKNPIWTLLMSGFIGIAIYAAISQDQFEDQNKYYYIAIGLPIWLLSRHLYWNYKEKSTNSQVSTALEIINKYGSLERAVEVVKFNSFEESYKQMLIVDKNIGRISEAEFQRELKALLIVGTEIEVGRYLTREEIEELVGFEEHITSIIIIRNQYETWPVS
mgnify:CR=1 FL=1